MSFRSVKLFGTRRVVRTREVVRAGLNRETLSPVRPRMFWEGHAFSRAVTTQKHAGFRPWGS
jgi:hypothetical protein